MLQVVAFFQDGEQEVYGHGDPDLSLNGIWGSSIKRLHLQVLLDPFEEQFDFPPGLVQGGNGLRRQSKIICQKDQTSLLRLIAEADPPQSDRVESLQAFTGQQNFLVATQTKGFIDRA